MPDTFKWLKRDDRETVLNTFSKPMSRGRGELAYRQLPKFLKNKTVAGKKHIIFVSYYPYIQVIKKSIILRKSGEYHTTLLSFCIREDTKAGLYFDDIFEIKDYKELLDIMLTANPSLYSVSIHPWILGIIAASAREITGVPVLIDLNDSYLFIEDDKSSVSCRMEKETLKAADGFFYRMDIKGIYEMRKEWELNTTAYEFQPLPFKDFFADCLPYEKGSLLKFAFGGGVIPYEIAKERGYENFIFDPLIKGTAGDRSSLSIYVNKNAREMFWEEHGHYFRLEKEYPNFSFSEGVPFYKLPSVLSAYHYGIYYENFVMASYNIHHFIYNMATKIFSYIEAGLPVLVHDKADCMKNFIEKHEIGATYPIEKPEEITTTAQVQDHQRLVENVHRFRKDNELLTATEMLVKAYDNHIPKK